MAALRNLLPLLLLAACGDATLPGRPPRHLLMVTVEGLRADHTSALMYHRPTTLQPVSAQQRAEGKALSIDDLAADGVLFSQAYAPSGDGGHGVLSILAGERGLHQDPEPVLAQRFSEGGSFTIAFVNDSANLPSQVEEGFHSCQRLESDLKVLIEAVRWFDVHDFGNCEGVFVWIHLAGPAFPFEPGVFADLLTREQVDFARLYDDPGGAAQMSGSWEERDAWWGHESPINPSPSQLERLVDLYDGGVAEMSSQLWFLLDYLHFATRSDQALDETVVVLAGVSGAELDRPGIPWGDSGEPRDSSLHVPLLFRHAGGLRGQRILSPVVELCDLAPTLCAWFALPSPAGGEGRNLLPLIGGFSPGSVRAGGAATATLDPRPAVALLQNPLRLTARDGRWRVVAELRDGPRGALLIDPASVQLFDSARDSREERDVAAEYPEQVERLLAAMAKALPSARSKQP